MTKIAPLDPAFSAGPEIHPPDVATLNAAGFRAIVCFRPDGEAPGQTPFHQIAAAAAAHGMPAAHIPLQAGTMSEEVALLFKRQLELLPQPIFGYCKSGMRAATTWAWSRRGSLPPGDIVQRLQEHGYGNAQLEQQLISQAASNPQNNPVHEK